jgi:hypothetical protein
VTGVKGNGVQTGDKINERMESREGMGEGDLYSRAKRRGRAIPGSGGLNRKRQRTRVDFTRQRKFQGKWQPKLEAFDVALSRRFPRTPSEVTTCRHEASDREMPKPSSGRR